MYAAIMLACTGAGTATQVATHSHMLRVGNSYITACTLHWIGTGARNGKPPLMEVYCMTFYYTS